MEKKHDPDFGDVAIGTLNKGEDMKRLDDRLATVAQSLHDFCLKHGFDLTKKTTAEVNLKVTFIHLESGMFAARVKISDKTPAAPISATMLVNHGGKLLVPLDEFLANGDDPHQKTLGFQKADSVPSNPKPKEM